MVAMPSLFGARSRPVFGVGAGGYKLIEAAAPQGQLEGLEFVGVLELE
jgi:hypothetical protein